MFLFLLFAPNAVAAVPSANAEMRTAASGGGGDTGVGTDASASELELEADAEAEAEGDLRVALGGLDAPSANALPNELVVQVNLMEPAPRVPSPARVFPFALDPFQKHAVALLEQHQNVCCQCQCYAAALTLIILYTVRLYTLMFSYW